MHDRTDHNRLAAQFAERLRSDSAFVEQRVAEINAFEARARGQAPRKPKRTRVTPVSPPVSPATTAAPVATQGATPTMSSMSLFQPAVVTAAYLKMGVMGKAGGGKTKTASKITIGLVKHLKKLGVDYADRPVAFFDTESGSDFVIPDFKEAGIPLVVAKSRTLADLVQAIDWAEAHASALIIDSITHPYREMIAAFLKKKQRTFLQIDDWQYLKGDHGWQMFSNRYLNSNLHIVMCGRAGDDLDQYTDENGKRQLEKVGVKMKTESETGFEPSLLVEMKLIEQNSMEKAARKRTFVNRAIVVKDRWDVINGDEIDNPDFADFLPHIEKLALGGRHVGFQDTGDSTTILKTEKRDHTPVQREICIDEIQTLLQLHFPSQQAEDKKNKLKAILKHFDATWTEIEKVMPLPDLRAGYDSLHQELEGRPSKYGTAIAKDAAPAEINDSLPTFADMVDESLPEPTAAAA